jgi:adenylate cyclase, class 2
VADSEAEIEAKFYLHHLADMRQKLLELGARLLASRSLEKNFRFDTPDRSLSRTGSVLRLRQDRMVHLTYKAPGASADIRREIELEVDDLNAARAFLEALGFERVFYYEKYREVFTLEPVQVMLDELPFGCFLEIEGESLSEIMQAARQLALDWDRRIPHSYPALFERLRRSLDLPFNDATFAGFSGRPRIRAADLAVREASSSQGPGGKP